MRPEIRKAPSRETLLVVVCLNLIFAFISGPIAQAATYNFSQSSWSGGASADTAVHPINRTNWSNYSSKSEGMNAGAGLDMDSLSVTSITQTDDGSTNTGFNLAGSTFSSTAVVSSGSGAQIKLTSNTATYPWTSMATTPGNIGAGGSLVYGPNDYIYALSGGSAFYRYSVGANSWTSLASTPGTVASGGSLVNPGAGDYIYTFAANGTTGFYRYSISGNSWATMAATPYGIAAGGSLAYPGSGDYIYGLNGNGSDVLLRYSISGNSWEEMATLPAYVLGGGALVYPGSGNYLYATTGGNTTKFYRYSISGNSWSAMTFNLVAASIGSSLSYPGTGDYIYFVGSGGPLTRYSITENTWEYKTYYPNSSVGTGSGSAASGNYIYVTRGGSSNEFYRYSISLDTGWDRMEAPPTAGADTLIVYAGDYVYATGASVLSTTPFYRYSPSTNTWTSMSTAPASAVSSGGMTYPGTGDYIYAVKSNGLYRYSISQDTWASLASPEMTASMSGLVSTGGDYLYLASGTVFKRYSISENTWSSMSAVPTSILNGFLVYEGGDYIYLVIGTNSYKYSISGNSWSAITSTSANAGSSAYYRSGYIYLNKSGVRSSRYATTSNTVSEWIGSPVSIAQDPGSSAYLNDTAYTLFYTSNFWRFSFNSYSSSGTFTSGAIDFGSGVSWGALSFSKTGDSVTIKARTSADSDFSDATDWSSCTNISSGSALSTGGCATDGHRYVQYQATLSTSDSTASPSLNDVTIAASYYPQNLVSSAYDTGSDANIIGAVSWVESLPADTGVTVSVRTAPTEPDLSSALWSDFTNATVGCSENAGTVTCSDSAIPEALKDGSGDRWYQYKVTLTSSGTNVPTVSSVDVQYVVNSTPEFDLSFGTNGLTVSQITDSASSDFGKVSISYKARDIDTTSGTNSAGFVTPSFEYNVGSGWVSIGSQYLNSGATNNKAVQEVDYTSYSATWNAKSQIPSTFSSNALVRVSLDDNEAANNSTTTTSTSFALDTLNPSLGANPILVDASVSPASLTLSATDDNSLEMKISTASNLAGASWVPYAGSATLAMQNGDSAYVQFRDSLGNVTAISSVSPPATPTGMFYQDISDASNDDWRTFFAWGVIDDPTAGFQRYNVYRNEDGGSYSLLTTISNRLVNYIVDSGLSSSVTYGYKVSAEDVNGNISLFSSSVSNTPDGVGGTDLASPTLSSISVTSTTTTGATITWTSNKLANSSVYYIATTTYPGSNKALYTRSTGVPSMVTSNMVTLSGLTPDTQYYFLVESTDASSNVGQSSASSYNFTTKPGPVISGTSLNTAYDSEATIIWNTNIAANSVVVYSINSDMSESTSISGSQNLTTSHRVTLTGLTRGTRYYYYVSSTDGDGNVATDSNTQDGVIQYHTFTTTSDDSLPVISDVSAALIGETGVTITWSTDKPSTSQVTWSLDSDLSDSTSTTETDSYTLEHAVVINSLSTSTQYYYSVLSTDNNGNQATDPSPGSAYSFITRDPSVATTTVYATTTVTVTVGGGGGGSSRSDTTAPSISNISVKQIGLDSVVVSFTASEIANGVVYYGNSSKYGLVAGDRGIYQKSHKVILDGLTPGITYHFKIESSDVSGNKGSTEDGTFKLSDTEGVLGDSSVPKSMTSSDTTLATSDSSIIGRMRNASAALASAVLESLVQNENLNNLSDPSLINIITGLTNKISASPSISGTNISVEPGVNSAIIKWTTDKPSNSLVSYATEANYNKNKDKPYTISAGLPDERVTDHSVKLVNLEPETKYYFQVRSQGELGPVGVSEDGNFTTASSKPQIVGAHFDSSNTDQVKLKWKTELPTNAEITLKNMRTGATTKASETGYETEHEYVFKKMDLTSDYTVTLLAKDTGGVASKSLVLPFSPSVPDRPAKISGLKITTSLIPERVETAQTIISWKTDKPASSKVMFGMGASSDLSGSTQEDGALVRDHVVITTALKPGSVYKIQAESKDSDGNVTKSELYTVMTPAPKGSAVDAIFNSLEKTFGAFKK